MNQNPTWQFIYRITRGYPEHPNYQDVQNYRQFLVSLQYVIPDPISRQYYLKYLFDHPISYYLNQQQTLYRWVEGLQPKPVNDPTDQPFLWNYLLLVGHQYPQQPTFQEIMYYKDFFSGLQNVWPNHSYRQWWVKHPIDPYLVTRQQLINWLNLMKPTTHDQLIEGLMMPTVLILTPILLTILMITVHRFI